MGAGKAYTREEEFENEDGREKKENVGFGISCFEFEGFVDEYVDSEEREAALLADICDILSK